MSDTDFDGMLGNSNGQPSIIETSKARVQAISHAIGCFIADKGWNNVTKKNFPNGGVAFALGVQVEKVSLKAYVTIHESPLAVTCNATLPMRCAPEYSLIVDEFITERNYDKLIGCFKRDTDGAVEYEYSFFVANAFSIDDFEKYLNFCLIEAANAYPDISKLCVGRLSKAKMAALEEKLATLAEALKN
jgi:hypothetical protein